MVYSKRYDNGLRLVVVPMNSMMSVTSGIMTGAGSCLENQDNNGISHFIEHATFKGTKTLSSFELSSAFDDIGAQANAFTSKETTCYYVKSAKFALERSFELLSDLFLNSVYDEIELEKEKGVVLEEINMCLDAPEEVCLDKLSEAYFGKQGLGRTILGEPQTVKSFKKSDIERFRSDFYNADNVVVSFAGNLTAETAEKLVEKYFLPFISTNNSKPFAQGDTTLKKGVIKTTKDIEQTHVALAFEGLKYADENIDAMNVLNNVAGAGMSSRLFQKIREELGLCYSIYSYPSCYSTIGTFAVYAGVAPKKAEVAIEAIFEVLKDIKKNGLKKAEFERGKAQTISSFVFGQESASSQMLLYARYLLSTEKIFDFEKRIKSVEALDEKSVSLLLEKMDFENFAASIVGKNAEKIRV